MHARRHAPTRCCAPRRSPSRPRGAAAQASAPATIALTPERCRRTRVVLPRRGRHGERREPRLHVERGLRRHERRRRRVRRARHARARARAWSPRSARSRRSRSAASIVSHYHADHVYGLQALKADGRRDLGAPQRARLLHVGLGRRAARAAARRPLPVGRRDDRASCSPTCWLDGDTDVPPGRHHVPHHRHRRRARARRHHAASRGGPAAVRRRPAVRRPHPVRRQRRHAAAGSPRSSG